MSAVFEQSHIEQILQSINIVDVIGSYVSLKPKGKEMVGLCPFHNDSRPSLNVNENKQIFKCFACGAGGDAFKFLMLRENLTFPEAVRLLAERAGVKLPQARQTERAEFNRNDLEAANQWAVRFYRGQFEDEQEGLRARKYLQERHISDETAQKFRLGWAPVKWDCLAESAIRAGQKIPLLAAVGLLVERETGGYYDRFRERLIFPVVDALGRVVAFGGRTLGDDTAKYINSPESALFNKSRALYGIHAAKDGISRERTAVVVEGYTDCLMAHQLGMTNVVATLGTALTAEHARVLSRYADRIVLVYDSDEAGQKAAERAIEIFFDQQIEVGLVSLPKGMDPCDFLLAKGKEAFVEIVRGAREALEYKWQATRARLEQEDTVNGRKRAVDEFIRVVAQSLAQSGTDAMSQGLVLNQVTKLVEMAPDELHRRVRRHLGQIRRKAEQGKHRQGIMPSADGYVNAQREILEVLLNRPELFAAVREVISGPEEFREDQHRAIAQRLWDYYGAGGQGPLGEILGACESPGLCQVITDLAAWGEKRGNYENTLAGALATVQRRKAKEQRQAIRQTVITAADEYDKETETAVLKDFQSRLRASHGIGAPNKT